MVWEVPCTDVGIGELFPSPDPAFAEVSFFTFLAASAYVRPEARSFSTALALAMRSHSLELAECGPPQLAQYLKEPELLGHSALSWGPAQSNHCTEKTCPLIH